MASDYQNAKVVITPHKKKRAIVAQTLWKADGTVRSTGTFENQLVWSDSVSKGPDVPNWKVRLSIGLPVNTPLNGYRVTVVKPRTGYAFIKQKPAYGNFDFFAFGDNLSSGGIVDPASSIDSTASKQAASNFWNDVEAKRTTWKGGAAIAEFRETVKFAAAPVKGMYREAWDFVGKISKLKKVYRSSPVNYGQAIGDAWLGYSLAVKPMLADIRDANKALGELSNELSPYDHVDVLGTGSRFINGAHTKSSVQHTNAAACMINEVTRYQVKYKARLVCRPPGGAQILDHFGINLGDIIPSVWEAIPFSVIVDYFANVGEMLTSLKYCRASLDGQYVSYRNGRSRVCSDWFLNPNVSTESGLVYGGSIVTTSVFVRRSPTLVPYPSWTFTIPGVGSTKWLNIGALAAAFLRSSPYGRLARAAGI